MKTKSKAFKIFISIVAVILALLLIALAVFGISYAEQTTRDNSTLGKTETKYTADESGHRIANIPYEDYIQEISAPADAVTVSGLSQDAAGEENGLKIQSTIDAVSQNGGGTVLIPQGKYKTNTIRLKDNVTLFVPYGAELISLTCDENTASASPLSVAVIYAENAENIAVKGGGTINGSGISYTNEPEKSTPLYALQNFNMYTRVIESRKRIRTAKDTVRNNILNFYNCENVEISNIILKDSATWTCVLNACDNVTITDLIIDNDMHVANSDGIDICGGENYKISHCFIATGDDGIVLKPSDNEIHNVTVENCTVSSNANCFKIGTETQMDVSDISVSDCYFFLADGMTYGYAGVSIESCDGSNIQNVTVSDITMDGVSAPFLVWLGNRFKYDKQKVGSINGVTLKNIIATNTEMPSAITGCVDGGETHYVENVTIENVKATYRDTGEDLHVRETVGEYTMRGYPEITRVSHIYFISHELSKYWDLPCYALCVRHAKNVNYENYQATPRTCSELEAYYLDDVTE